MKGFALSLAVILSGAVFNSAEGADYFVDARSPIASDNNNGSAASPWRTIQKASAVLVAGDSVTVRAGTYSGRVYPANSGTAAQYIRYLGEPGAIIDGAGFTVNQKRYIEISGFKIQNVPGPGIAVNGPNTSFIRILNNYTWNTGDSGISVWGRAWGNDPAECNYACVTDVLIEGNRVERANNAALGGYNEHITVASGVQRVTIKKNIVTAGPPTGDPLVTRPGGEGIDLKEGVTDAWISENDIYDMVYCRYAIYIDAGGSTWGYPGTYKTVPGWIRNIHVFRNRVFNNDSHGIGVTSEGSGNLDGVYIYNNLVVGQGTDGILVYDWGLPSRPNPPNPLPAANNIFIFNNTVTGNARLVPWFGGIAVDHAFATNINIRNNITYGQNNNIRLPLVPPGTLIDTNVTTDPRFVNPSGQDYRVQNGSPAIDAASANLPMPLTFDYAGLTRPIGVRADIGAFEFGAQIDTVKPTTPGGLSAPTVAATSILLSWSASTDNVGVTGYRISRNGVVVGNVSETSFTDTGLTQQSTYSYTVAAVDAANNRSSESTPLSLSTPAIVSPPDGTAYLSNLTPTYAANGWGPFERDLSNGERGLRDGRSLTINGKVYAKGLGVHADSDLRYRLGNKCATFSAEVGIDDEVTVGDGATVQFTIFADGVQLWQSGVLDAAAAAVPVSVNVQGRNELRLLATDGGNGKNSDHGDWGDAKILCNDVPSQPSNLQVQ